MSDRTDPYGFLREAGGLSELVDDDASRNSAPWVGSSGKQEKLLQAVTRGLEDIARVEPWTTSFNPGTTTLERLVELAHEVDFAAFAFARDDWTTISPAAPASAESAQASPRDNVVFEAGLFGGVLGMRRTFITRASVLSLPGWAPSGGRIPWSCEPDR